MSPADDYDYDQSIRVIFWQQRPCEALERSPRPGYVTLLMDLTQEILIVHTTRTFTQLGFTAKILP